MNANFGYRIIKVTDTWYKLIKYVGDKELLFFGFTPEQVKHKAGVYPEHDNVTSILRGKTGRA